MENVIRIKEDKRVTVMLRDPETEKALSNLKQLCLECDNNCQERCQLVRDIHQLSIDKYGFVKVGYQLVGASGKPISLIVSECDNFVKTDVNDKNYTRILKR